MYIYIYACNVCLQGLFDSKITAITEMALSFNHKLLALFSDTGAIWIGTSDLIKGNEHNTK